MLLISGSANIPFAQSLATALHLPLVKRTISRFPDGETKILLHDKVRGKDAILIQTINHPANDNLLELCLIANALRNNGVKKLILLAPYIAYMRQDYSALKPGAPHSAQVVANIVNSLQVDCLITIDLHSSRSTELFTCLVDNLSSQAIFQQDLLNKALKNPIIVAPDIGGIERATKFAKLLNIDLATIQKIRSANDITTLNIIGTVQNRDCIVLDDIIDSASTICNAAKILKIYGAKRIFAYATHGIFSAGAIQNIAKSNLEETVITDTIKLINNSLFNNNLRQISLIPAVNTHIVKHYLT